ncbi:MAG: phage major capsid protein [Thermodesulfobacteriota bacterium]|nr:phage major capsid protein [Thermodesulfobacteriota bacterium]
MSKKSSQKSTTIKTGIFYRMTDGGVDVRGIDEEKRTVKLSFSSEAPVDRYFGQEILNHDQKSVNLTFLNSGRAPLLKDHFSFEQTGVVESARIGTDRMGRAVVRFGKSQLADDEFNDVVDGIRSNVSVGYRINKMVLEEQSEENGDVYRVVDWEPLEISIVSIPADQSVGVGRAARDSREFETMVISERSVNKMPDQIVKQPDAVVTRSDPPTAAAPKAPEIDVDQIRRETAQAEQRRAADIIALGEMHGYRDDAIQAIKDGKTVDQFRQFVLDKLAEKGLTPVEDPDPAIGLSGNEQRQFSFIRLIRALADPKDAKLAEEAGFELECSRAVADKIKKAPRGAFIPWDVMLHGQRDLNTTDDAALVATNLLAGSFIDVLRNKMVVKLAGARILDGLIGNVAIPKKTAGASVYWVAEGITENPTESEASYGTVSLSPKTVGTYTEITRQMLLQSTPAIEMLTRDDLAVAVALGIDLAALHGTGVSNQPTGIAATSGIGSVAGGANGLAPTDDHIIDLETEVAIDNADLGALAYITNAKVRGKLKKTDIGTDTGQRVWDRQSPKSPLNGYPAHVTNQVKSDLDKGTSTGVCSAIFFGNWSDLLIGMWGALDILVDPYTYSKSGGLLVRALQDVDTAVRHAESFSAMLDALTTP